jgi:hypothetical protein
MADSRSIEIFKGLRDAQQKLDYFLLGLASALFAYIGGQYQPMPITFSQNTAELISLSFLFASIIAGFKRLDLNISLMKLNFNKLDTSEKKGALTQALSMRGTVLNSDTGKCFDRIEAKYILSLIDEHEPKLIANIEKYINYSGVAFSIRNWCLILGFVFLAISKFIGVYLVTKSV